MLSHLSVRNFRALESVEIPLSQLTAIVGPNGAGKTSVLRAIDLLFGEAWPSLRSFRIPQDFTNFDTSRTCAIRVFMDPPYTHEDLLGTKHEVQALQVVCKPYKVSGKHGQAGDLHVDVEPIGKDNKVPMVAVSPPRKGQKPDFRPLSVSTGMREHARVLFVDHRRSLLQHLPSGRGSILGKMLEPARRDFAPKKEEFRERYEEAMQVIRTEKVKEIEAKIEETAKRMLGFLGSRATADVQIGFGFSDPSNPFTSLRLQYRESGLEVPGEELGLGIQSAMVVGIFEAFRQLGGTVGTIVIEEPEMYLHPQAQRYFFRLLSEMTESGGCQVIYATHSPVFADVNRFESLRLVRRLPGSMSSVSYVKDASDLEFLTKQREAYKVLGRFDPGRNEVLFAQRALLVEGPGDRLAALLVAEKLGLDVDAEDYAIVDCGGKNGIPLVARVCRSLEIPFWVMHDKDIWPEGAPPNAKTAEENRTAAKENESIRAAVSDDTRLFHFEQTLEEALGIGRNASDKPRRVAEVVQARNPEELPKPLVDAVSKLFEEVVTP